jgi:uncharacterized membrane protein YccC
MVALDAGASAQDYRLARKAMVEALAALSDSAGRMGGEPQTVRRGLDEMAAMLIAGYVLAAHISATRLFVRERRGAEDFPIIVPRLQATRDWLIALLSDQRSPAEPVGAPAPRGELGQEFLRLRKAARALLAAAAVYRRAATSA